MKFNNGIKVYGDKTKRGKCPPESAEQITFFNWLRREYPDVAIDKPPVHPIQGQAI